MPLTSAKVGSLTQGHFQGRRCCLKVTHLRPVAALTNGPRLGGLKQHTFIIASESEVWQGSVSLGGNKGVSRGRLHPRLVAPSSSSSQASPRHVISLRLLRPFFLSVLKDWSGYLPRMSPISGSAGQRRNCICTLHSPSQVLRSVAWTPLGARCSPHQRWLQCGSSGQFDLCNLRAGPRQGSDLRRDSLRRFRGIRERRKRGWVNSVASLCRGQRADFGSSLSDREWSGLGHTKLRTGVPRSGADRRILLNEAPAATCSSSATSCRRCKPGSQPSKKQFGVNDFQNK